MTWMNKYERPIDPPDWYWDGHNEDEGDQDAADAAKEQEWLDEQEENENVEKEWNNFIRRYQSV